LPVNYRGELLGVYHLISQMHRLIGVYPDLGKIDALSKFPELTDAG